MAAVSESRSPVIQVCEMAFLLLQIAKAEVHIDLDVHRAVCLGHWGERDHSKRTSASVRAGKAESGSVTEELIMEREYFCKLVTAYA